MLIQVRGPCSPSYSPSSAFTIPQSDSKSKTRLLTISKHPLAMPQCFCCPSPNPARKQRGKECRPNGAYSWARMKASVVPNDEPMVTLPVTWSLPTQEDLPCDDGIPMETQRHKMQMDLLIDGLTTWMDQQQGGYVGGNMFIYFSLDQVRHQDFRGPDVFVVLDVPKKERKSWVVWEEGKAPDIVIELLSESSLAVDKGRKKQIYQDYLRVWEYYWYDPFNPDDWAGFVLVRGKYEPLPVNEQGYLVSPCTGLVLRRWTGDYRGVHTTWLRWAYPDGQVLPTAQELAQQAQQEARLAQQAAAQAQQEARLAQQAAEQARQEARLAQERVAQLSQKLRELGVNPESL